MGHADDRSVREELDEGWVAEMIANQLSAANAVHPSLEAYVTNTGPGTAYLRVGARGFNIVVTPDPHTG